MKVFLNRLKAFVDSDIVFVVSIMIVMVSMFFMIIEIATNNAITKFLSK